MSRGHHVFACFIWSIIPIFVVANTADRHGELIAVSIEGAVLASGSFTLPEDCSLVDALAKAGGLTDDADALQIYILRLSSDGSVEKIHTPVDAILRGRSRHPEYVLCDRDSVIVPRKGQNQPVETTAAAARPPRLS